jgi:thymidylate synthase
MYLAVDQQPSCARTWLAAVQKLDTLQNREAYNVILNVADPLLNSDSDKKIVAEVDSFLRAHSCYPVETVANTIFPQSTYDLHGAPAFYDAYLTKVYPKIKRSQGDWGRYFERMIAFPSTKNDEVLNPLRDIVEKMTRQVQGDRCFKHVYEITIYDPSRDAGPVMNRQCLSFLSFKLSDGAPRKLMLTAVYRNHYYLQRLLGNLIGLGRLMRFIATEAGVAVGDLTIVSTHAEIDAIKGANHAAVKDLISRCEASQSSAAEEPSVTETQAVQSALVSVS